MIFKIPFNPDHSMSMIRGTLLTESFYWWLAATAKAEGQHLFVANSFKIWTIATVKWTQVWRACALISHTASSCRAAMTAWAIEARMDAGSRSGNAPCWDQYNLVSTKNSKVLELQTEPAPGCIFSTEHAEQDHASTEIHYCPPRELCAHRSTKVFTFKQLLTRTQFTEALGRISNTVQWLIQLYIHRRFLAAIAASWDWSFTVT